MPPCRSAAHIDGHHEIGVRQKIEGQGIYESAIDENAAIELDRRQERGHGGACGKRRQQGTGGADIFALCEEVGRYRYERNLSPSNVFGKPGGRTSSKICSDLNTAGAQGRQISQVRPFHLERI